MRIDLLFFGDQAPGLAVIPFLAIAATLFVHCNLMRRPWFLTFLAVTAATHLAVVIMFPGAHLDPNQFKLFAVSDTLAVISLAFCVEKLVALRQSTPATDFTSPDISSSFKLVRSSLRMTPNASRRAFQTNIAPRHDTRTARLC